jgi:hypothetical protein
MKKIWLLSICTLMLLTLIPHISFGAIDVQTESVNDTKTVSQFEYSFPLQSGVKDSHVDLSSVKFTGDKGSLVVGSARVQNGKLYIKLNGEAGTGPVREVIGYDSNEQRWFRTVPGNAIWRYSNGTEWQINTLSGDLSRQVSYRRKGTDGKTPSENPPEISVITASTPSMPSVSNVFWFYKDTGKSLDTTKDGINTGSITLYEAIATGREYSAKVVGDKIRVDYMVEPSSFLEGLNCNTFPQKCTGYVQGRMYGAQAEYTVQAKTEPKTVYVYQGTVSYNYVSNKAYLTGSISTDKNFVDVPEGQSATVQVTVDGTMKNLNDPNAIDYYRVDVRTKDGSQYQYQNVTADGSTSVSRTFSFTIPASKLTGVSSYDEEFIGRVRAFYKAGYPEVDEDSGELKTSVKFRVIKVPPSSDPHLAGYIYIDPNVIEFAGSDVPVDIQIRGILSNVSDTNNLDYYRIDARTNDGSQSQYKNIPANGSTSVDHSFSFTIPASKLNGVDEYTEIYVGRVRVFYKDGTPNEDSGELREEVIIYKVEPQEKPPAPTPAPEPEPEPSPNQSPVARINAPSSVKAGDNVSVSGAASTDPDGNIASYSWSTTGANGSISGSIGSIWYDSTGTKMINLCVTDNAGATDCTSHTLTVTEPYPEASIEYTGTLKENRKITISSASNSPTNYPITSYSWTITALTGGASTDIKTDGSLTSSNEDILIKKAGEYELKLTVTNSAGYSDTATRTITIKPDQPPIADFTTISKVYRDPENGNFFKIQLWDRSYSPDGDNITKRVWKYAYDSDNDRLFTDESWVTIDSTNKEYIELYALEVGWYQVELEVTESFGQPTISSYITTADYRTGNTWE